MDNLSSRPGDCRRYVGDLMSMISEDRKLASRLITRFLTNRLTESDARDWHRVNESYDETVRLAAKILAEFYEGYEDDVSAMEESEWDFLERIRLVLLSNWQLTEDPKPRLELSNCLATLGILIV